MSEEATEGVYEGPVGDGDGGAAPLPASGQAIAALICGIGGLVLGLFSCCCWIFMAPLAMIVGGVGFVLGLMARRQALAGQAGGGGMALAGMICGGIGAFFGLAWLVLGIVLTATGAADELMRNSQFKFR